MNMGKDQVAILLIEIRDDLLPWCNRRQRSEMMCCHGCLARSQSLRKGETLGWLRASELLGWKCPRGEELLLEWLQNNRDFWLLRHVS